MYDLINKYIVASPIQLINTFINHIIYLPFFGCKHLSSGVLENFNNTVQCYQLSLMTIFISLRYT